MSCNQCLISTVPLILISQEVGAQPCFPQATTGSNMGRVSNASGTVIPDAKVAAFIFTLTARMAGIPARHARRATENEIRQKG
jgi:hypothetical protein